MLRPDSHPQVDDGQVGVDFQPVPAELNQAVVDQGGGEQSRIQEAKMALKWNPVVVRDDVLSRHLIPLVGRVKEPLVVASSSKKGDAIEEGHAVAEDASRLSHKGSRSGHPAGGGPEEEPATLEVNVVNHKLRGPHVSSEDVGVLELVGSMDRKSFLNPAPTVQVVGGSKADGLPFSKSEQQDVELIQIPGAVGVSSVWHQVIVE